MKTKILIAILAIVVIALGVLLGMKVFQNQEVENVSSSEVNEANDPLKVVLNDKKEEGLGKFQAELE